MIFIYILYVLTALYCLFLVFLIIGTLRLKKKQVSDEIAQISVIVAARNEEEHLNSLVDSLLAQEYPNGKYEIIIVNDRSTDKTESLLQNYTHKYPQIKYISVGDKESDLIGKKRALTQGIEAALGEILLFTDADCRPGKYWIRSMNDTFSRGFDAVVGYSPLRSKSTSLGKKILSLMKKLERLAMFAFSAGSIGWNWGITATGRNFAYKRSVFNELHGFDGIGHIPSGDDDLFLQKISRSRKYTIGFTTQLDSFVPTVEKKTGTQTFQQEKRRGSKWRYYPTLIKIISLIAFMYLLLLVVCFLLACTGAIPWKVFLISFSTKSVFDLLIILRGAVMFHDFLPLITFLFVEILYAPYFILFGLLGTFSKYKWK